MPDESQVCGRNALYALLRMHFVSRSFDDVKRVTLIAVAGTTLTELRDASLNLGLPCDMVRTDVASLRQSGRLPCIVLTSSGGLIPGAHGESVAGHYFILLDFSDKSDEVHLMDGTYGVPMTFTREHFQNVWTGAALLPRPAGVGMFEGCLTSLHVFLWLFVLVRLGPGRPADVVSRDSNKGDASQRTVGAVGVHDGFQKGTAQNVGS
jgi:ABC-type bacteriocin/lantibiotic exporter with double-glycine peptidase domain